MTLSTQVALHRAQQSVILYLSCAGTGAVACKPLLKLFDVVSAAIDQDFQLVAADLEQITDHTLASLSDAIKSRLIEFQAAYPESATALAAMNALLKSGTDYLTKLRVISIGIRALQSITGLAYPPVIGPDGKEL